MEFDKGSPQEVIFHHLFVLIGSAAIVAHLLHFHFSLLSSLVAHTRLSVFAIKGILLTGNFFKSLLLALFVFAFPFPAVFAALFSLILSFSIEIQGHLKRRTTAAYSTSDSQTQRFFNVRLLAITSAIGIALIFDSVHLNPFPESFPLFLIEHRFFWPFMGVLCIAQVLFLSDLLIFFRHSRTVAYVLQSHMRSLFQRKLKRYW